MMCQHVGRWLREKRIENGLTLRELADKMGVTHIWILRTEQSKRRIDLVEYLRFCSVLALDPHEGLRLVQSEANASLQDCK